MSALYKSGTVTVTNGSNIVTGSGTSFISIAGIVPGALFTIDGVNWYEVYEVNTNTQIKVRTIPAGQTFQQATASGQDYAIFQNFTSLSPTEIAARVVAIQQKWHIREEEMTDWFASTNDFEEITNINGDKITVMTPFGVNNLLGTAATRNVGTESGNVMEVGAFGLGSTGKFISLTDWHQLAEYETGFYTSLQSAQNSVNNSPPITTTNINYTIFVQRDGVRVKITAYVSKGVQAFTKTYTGSAWTDWFENYDSGNSVNPLDYGLGLTTSSAQSITYFGNNVPSGFYKSKGGGGNTHKPETDTHRSSVLAYPADTGTNFIYQRNVSTSGDIKAWLGCTRPQTNDVAWSELYHSGNTNFNEFGSLTGPSGDNFAIAYGTADGRLNVTIPINFKVIPSSISVQGTFMAAVVEADANVITGISNFTLAARASANLACLVTDPVGATSGKTYFLRVESPAAKITVNP